MHEAAYPFPNRRHRMLWVLLLTTLMVVGCQSLTSLPFASRSAGLPPQHEAQIDE
ncbi:MAG: hypothetical protein KDA58_03205 [Planctomycetaceae bacterium]|nr:hypothetical protein [Planctomycetaceae bacterium]